jgi:hypothetical protein
VSEQQGQDLNQVLGAVASELQTLRQQTAQQQAAIARLAQEREAAARAAAQPAKPAVGPGDLAQVNDRFLDELGRNPLRVFSEFQAATKEATKAEIKAELERERAQHTAVAQATQYSQAVLAANPDVQGREWQVGQMLDWANANRPDLTYQQRVQAAVEWTRQAMHSERNVWDQQRAYEDQQRRAASMPTGGAYGSGGANVPVNELEARRARLSAMTDRTSNAFRGAYPRAGSKVA